MSNSVCPGGDWVTVDFQAGSPGWVAVFQADDPAQAYMPLAGWLIQERVDDPEEPEEPEPSLSGLTLRAGRMVPTTPYPGSGELVTLSDAPPLRRVVPGVCVGSEVVPAMEAGEFVRVDSGDDRSAAARAQFTPEGP